MDEYTASTRMTTARLVVELRRRSEPLRGTWQGRADEALAALGALALVGRSKEADVVRCLLAALIGAGGQAETNAADLECISEDTICQLDTLIEAMLLGWYEKSELRDRLRPILLRPVY